MSSKNPNASNGITKKRPKQIDFIVNTGDPNAASSIANKKRVRSVAALKSWPERRKKIFDQLEISANGQSAFLAETDTTTTSAKKKKKNSPIVPTLGPNVAGPSPPPVVTLPKQGDHDAVSQSVALYHQAMSRVPAKKDAVLQVHSVHSDATCNCSQCRNKRRIANIQPSDTPESQDGAVFINRRASDWSGQSESAAGVPSQQGRVMITPPASPERAPSRGRGDPFNCYPVEYEPVYDQVLQHMMMVYAPRGWPALKITEPEGRKWEWFMTQNALAEPALFFVRLVFGSGDMVKLGVLRKDVMYWLRAQAIKAINEAIIDPKRCCSDPMILAVGRVALFEHMYADPHASLYHRKAQKRLVDMRGGMKELQFSPLVKRLMRWSDRIMAMGSGTERFLEDEGDNPNYSLKESVKAIERWAPHEIQRRNIKISDIVNDEDES